MAQITQFPGAVDSLTRGLLVGSKIRSEVAELKQLQLKNAMSMKELSFVDENTNLQQQLFQANIDKATAAEEVDKFTLEQARRAAQPESVESKRAEAKESRAAAESRTKVQVGGQKGVLDLIKSTSRGITDVSRPPELGLGTIDIEDALAFTQTLLPDAARLRGDATYAIDGPEHQQIALQALNEFQAIQDEKQQQLTTAAQTQAYRDLLIGIQGERLGVSRQELQFRRDVAAQKPTVGEEFELRTLFEEAKTLTESIAEAQSTLDFSKGTEAGLGIEKGLKEGLKRDRKKLEDLVRQMIKTGRQKRQQPPSTGVGPKVGDVIGGFRFKGGDPSKQSNWEKVK